MKNVAYSQFGGIEVLQINEENIPTVKAPTEVLVQVKAISINPLDWKIRKGEMKLMSGSKFPKHIGIDFAGIVAEVGGAVTDFKKGDAVFGAVNGMKEGALGEYVLVSSKSLWHKPAKISFAQAASIPIVGAGAHAAMVDIAQVAPNLEVLLNGATGGMGMFALQLAKQRGANVTAVTNTEGSAFAQKWGADRVIDYTKTNVLSENKQYDAIFDLSGKMPFEKAKAILKAKSVFINPVPQPIQIIGTAITNLFTSRKNKVLLSNVNDKAMLDILTAIDKGLEIEVNQTFPFAQFAEAYRYAEKGGFIGKVVIEI